MPTRIGRLCLLASLSVTTMSAAEMSPRGIIRDDAQWSGEITIEQDVSIANAEVRVEAGSTIRFVSRAEAKIGPVIRLRGPTLSTTALLRPTRFVLAGTADRPIVIESGPDGPTGSITSARDTSGTLIARHVVFRRLGTASRSGFHPAILLQLTSPDDDLWLTDCRFERCGPVQAEFIGTGGTADVRRCVFSETVGSTALVLLGTGTGVKIVRNNYADAAFHFDCSQVLARDNVLIGDSVALAVRMASVSGITLADNYVRCTSSRDDGRYVVRCDAASAVLADNVLIGGSYVVDTSPRTVTGNVFIGVAGLRAKVDLPGVTASAAEVTTTTHGLISDPSPECVIRGNLLLGPAYAAVATGQRTDRLRLEHNLFDGWGQARRAVEFNVLARKAVGATFSGNVVVNYQQPPIVDNAGLEGTLTKTQGNAFAAVPETVYEKIAGLQGLGTDDVRFERAEDLRFEGIPAAATQAAADAEEALRAGRLRVADIRQKWFDAYRPRPDSPLVTTRPAGPWSAPNP